MDYIRKNNFNQNEVMQFLNECIIPDLKSLKLDEVIPALEAEISKLFNLDDCTRRNSCDSQKNYDIER